MSQYGTLITRIGLAKIANAQVTQSTVGLEYIALGDGNGAHYVPTQDQTELVNEVWRGPIANLSIDPNNNNRIIADAVIPNTAGGFTIREIGLFDEDNYLIAVGQYPETYKPLLNEGISEELLIHFTIETANANVVKLAIDPTVIIASRSYVDGKVGEVRDDLTAHKADYEQFKSETETNLASIVKIKTNVKILATGWYDDQLLSGFFAYDIVDSDITINTVVDVNIHLNDLDNAVNIKSSNISSAAKVTIYASEIPQLDIMCDLKLIKQVI